MRCLSGTPWALDARGHDGERLAARANFSQPDKELIVYRYLGELDNPLAPLTVELLSIGKTIERK